MYKKDQRNLRTFFPTGESFPHFDHGPAGNLKRYGTTDPPEYNLTTVTAPVYIFYAENDPFVSIEVTSDLNIQTFELKSFC